jgi:hypothetical protein
MDDVKYILRKDYRRITETGKGVEERRKERKGGIKKTENRERKIALCELLPVERYWSEQMRKERRKETRREWRNSAANRRHHEKHKMQFRPAALQDHMQHSILILNSKGWMLGDIHL